MHHSWKISFDWLAAPLIANRWHKSPGSLKFFFPVDRTSYDSSRNRMMYFPELYSAWVSDQGLNIYVCGIDCNSQFQAAVLKSVVL